MIPSAALRVVVLHNNDYANLLPDDPGFSARADVENAAWGAAEALIRKGHRAEVMGVDSPSLGTLIDQFTREPPDVVFNLCESLRGDARHEIVIPALLELAGIPYTGSNPVSLGLALRKDRAKMILRARGVPTPEAVTLSSIGDARGCRLPFPLIVKPTREDASVGITSRSVVHSGPELEQAVARVLEEFRQPALVERYIEGREMYVSLLGNQPPEALPMHEIDFSDLPDGLPRIVSYSGKWDESSPEFHGTRPIRCVLDETVRTRVVRAAREAFEAIELSDYGRVDIRLAADNTPYVIDVNPNCDVTDGAGFARAAGYAGLTYPDLMERVCRIALERHHAQRPHHNTTPTLPQRGAAAGDEREPPAGAQAATGGSPAAPGADLEGRPVPARRGGVRPRADRRGAR